MVEGGGGDGSKQRYWPRRLSGIVPKRFGWSSAGRGRGPGIGGGSRKAAVPHSGERKA